MTQQRVAWCIGLSFLLQPGSSMYAVIREALRVCACLEHVYFLAWQRFCGHVVWYVDHWSIASRRHIEFICVCWLQACAIAFTIAYFLDLTFISIRTSWRVLQQTPSRTCRYWTKFSLPLPSTCFVMRGHCVCLTQSFGILCVAVYMSQQCVTIPLW